MRKNIVILREEIKKRREGVTRLIAFLRTARDRATARAANLGLISQINMHCRPKQGVVETASWIAPVLAHQKVRKRDLLPPRVVAR